MGGARPRAAATGCARPDRPPHSRFVIAAPLRVIAALPLRRTRAPSVIPAPPFVIPAQAGTTAHNTHPFPNSSLPPGRGEVRWGVRGHERPPQVVRAPIAHLTPAASLLRPSASSLRSPLRRTCASSVIPAQAGITHRANPHLFPFPNSSLPPFRGEARWGVRGHERPPQVVRAPIAHLTPAASLLRLSSLHPRSHPSFLRRQEPPCAAKRRPTRSPAASKHHSGSPSGCQGARQTLEVA